MRNLQVRLRRLPQHIPTPDDFELVENEVPRIGSGQFLCRTRWVAVDAWVHAPGAGTVVPARGVGEIIDSRHDVFGVGQYVVFDSGLQELSVSDGARVHHLHPGQTPASVALGVLGLPGMAAYFGLVDLAEVQPGETVLVSAAANAAGCMAGQIAKIYGARAIGIAGSKEKCDWVTRHARFAACINYRTESLDARIEELAPGGVNVFFDSTGGELLEKVLSGKHLAPGARVVLSDLVARHNSSGSSLAGFTDSRIRVVSLATRDFEHRREEFLKQAIAWHGEGLVTYKEDVVEGLPNAPAHICRQMRGENFGKPVIKVHPAAARA
jgi:NADPH-dependent curcumin reductase